MPGKTAWLTFWAQSFLHRMKPPRGPRSVLCVVEVTKSATGTGSACSSAATRPAMWAMSTMNSALFSQQISAKRAEVDLARIGAGAGHDQLRPVLLRQPGHLVEVDPLGVAADAVADDVVQLAREVQPHAVGQVAAVGQVHGQDGVAGLQAGEVDRHVGLGPGVRLDVGLLGAEELAGPARWPAARRRPRTRSRRSSAGPG